MIPITVAVRVFGLIVSIVSVGFAVLRKKSEKIERKT